VLITCDLLIHLLTYLFACPPGENAFADTNMETVDLLACSKLNSVRSEAFANNGITKLMLPKNLKINGTKVRLPPLLHLSHSCFSSSALSLLSPM